MQEDFKQLYSGLLKQIFATGLNPMSEESKSMQRDLSAMDYYFNNLMETLKAYKENKS